MDNTEKTKNYFDKYSKHLRHMKDSVQSGIVQATALSLEGKLKGEVLDIGSGGRIDYSLDQVKRLVSLDVSSKSLTNKGENSKVEFIQGDARRLNMDSNIFDRVVILHTIHHLAGNNVSSSYQNVEMCFGEALKVLKPTGRILIIDAVCPNFIQKLESLFFWPNAGILRIFKKPMVYYYSLEHLCNMLKAIGFKNINITTLDTRNSLLCPFTSSVGIPFKYTPLTHVLIEGSK